MCVIRSVKNLIEVLIVWYGEIKYIIGFIFMCVLYVNNGEKICYCCVIIYLMILMMFN